MVIIKGPLYFKKGFSINEFLKGQDIKVKLPFKATGWKSTKIPKGIALSGIKFKKDEPKKETVIKKVIKKVKSKKTK